RITAAGAATGLFFRVRGRRRGWPLALNPLPTFLVNTLYESRHFFQQWQANQRRAEQLARRQHPGPARCPGPAARPALSVQLAQHPGRPHRARQRARPALRGGPGRRVPLRAAGPRAAPPCRWPRSWPSCKPTWRCKKYASGKTCRCSYDLPPAALARHVAPLSVQLLVENALKHNEASRARPLHLRLVAAPAPRRCASKTPGSPAPAGLAPGTGTGPGQRTPALRAAGRGPAGGRDAGRGHLYRDAALAARLAV
ncbi:MAG: hypothetical protein WKG07_14975, partial [Hymenobacter sp.]